MVNKILKSFTQYFLVSFLVTSCLVACVSDQETVQTKIIATPIQVEPTILNTVTVLPTATKTQLITPSPIPATVAPVPTEIPVFPLNKECLEILPSLPESTSLNGLIFLWLSTYSTSPPVMINMETGLVTEYPELAKVGPFQPSPDNRWLAINDPVNSKLVLLDASGSQKEITDWDEQWFYLVDWLNDETLAIALHGQRTGKTMPPQGAYNLISGEYLEFNRDYPDIDYLAETDYQWLTSTRYDPSLTSVVYIAVDRTESPYLKLALMDLQTKDIVAELGPWDYSIEPAKWSPDGSQFVTAHALLSQGNNEWHQEIFSISHDGKIKQLTNFNEHYENPRVGTMSWSPDGRYVAFWFLDYLKDKYETLAVLDIETMEVVNYCIPGNQHTLLSPAPIWSPNSQQILVKSILEDGNHSQVILIDPSQGYAAQIAENMTPKGWLIPQQ